MRIFSAAKEMQRALQQMSKAIKAALLSTLVFPGTGHLLLKKYLHATVLIGASFSVLYLMISRLIEIALQISDKIISGEVGLDVVAITELIVKQTAGPETRLLNIAGVVLIIIWLISIVDSYRIGRLQDKDP